MSIVDKTYDSLKRLTEKDMDLTVIKFGLYHLQLKGLFNVNIYPTRKRYYINGATKGGRFTTLSELISYARGESLPQGLKKVKRKTGSNRKLRQKLWDQGIRDCYVCGEPFTSFEETTLEHNLPLSAGGSNRRDNLSLSHEKCNQGRHET